MKDNDSGPELLRHARHAAQAGKYSGRYEAEVTEHRNEISAALARGYTWRVVWQAFQATTRTSMCFKTFRRHCRRLHLNRKHRRSAARVSGSAPAFVHSPVPNDDELF